MKIVAGAVAAASLGNPVSFGSLEMFPLLAKRPGKPVYWLLEHAFLAGDFEITELSDRGSVPELKAINRGDRPVLLLDGEELLGAKQNRVLNLSVLVPALAELVIPVSCVEAGRWAHSSRSFSSAQRAQYAAGRAERVAQVSESLRTEGVPLSDQSSVWQSISAKSARMGYSSPSSAMSGLYEVNSDRLDQYVRALVPQRDQVGAVFAIGGRVVGMELFQYPSILKQALPALVRSYALDAIEVEPTARPMVTAATVSRLLDKVASATEEKAPPIGAGENVRLVAAGVTGAALLAGEDLVHMVAFASGVDDAAAEEHREEPDAVTRDQGRWWRFRRR